MSDNPITNLEHKAETALNEAVADGAKAEKNLLKNKWVRSGGLVAAVLIIAGGLLYWQTASTRVSIDNSLVSAPTIALAPTAAGTLNQIYVNVGDQVLAGTVVAQVGNELIKTKVAGIIVSEQNDTGKIFNPGQAVVNMIDPTELRVIGTIAENKGLSQIQVGQKAAFTVDAFGSKTYNGIVDEVSPTANQADVVFNISDQRATQDFDVKVRFNPDQYPELKNGMSAKLTIFTK
jgi:multidrug resistance efflux pump